MSAAPPSFADAPAPWWRDAELDRLPDQVDVLVVGGGITGAGVALDAAHRGASVALVDAGDLARGTSSRSSRLVHGGARYLATGDVAMVTEGVRERDRLRAMAPHLVLPLPFVVPADRASDLALLRAGMLAYDALAAGRGVATHRVLGPAGVLRHAPGLTSGYASGGVRYWDCRTDDARLTLEVARAAAAHGAVVAPHVAVTGLERVGGRIGAARLRDAITDEERVVTARWVVAAGGVWAGAIRDLAAGPGDLDVVAERRALDIVAERRALDIVAERRALDIVAARGVHLVFDRADLPVNAAVVVPSAAADGRRVFVVPWGGQVYVGTTDDVHGGAVDDPTVAPADAAYVLAATNAAFGTDLAVADAVSAWAGLRPLLRGDAATGRGDGRATADLSRRHAIVDDPAGLVTVTGGKLTTFRRMAADVVDRIASADGWRRSPSTATVALGSSGDLAVGRAHVRAVAAHHGLGPDAADGLHHRHGDRAAAVVALCAERDELGPLVDGLPYLRGEVRWAARHELVGRLDDVLRRRLRVSTRHRAAGGRDAVGWAADVVTDELGWSRRRRDAEVAAYLEAARVERGEVPLAT